ncbi:uncharacterized protein [Arachis hypogaea]|uniref:uncharacterized protein n=1 Tax=Arachis hypogaea TaxID=3818 RepID=UPI003B218D9E
MCKALNAKRKLGFINGSVFSPASITEPESFENWQCVNDVVSKWILNSVSKAIATSLVYTDSAAKGTMSVSQYFTKIKVLWEELNSYKPVQCNCVNARAMHAFLQAEYVHCFLMGLDDSFTQIRDHILLMEPILAVNKVLSLITQEEKHRALEVGSNLT